MWTLNQGIVLKSSGLVIYSLHKYAVCICTAWNSIPSRNTFFACQNLESLIPCLISRFFRQCFPTPPFLITSWGKPSICWQSHSSFHHRSLEVPRQRGSMPMHTHIYTHAHTYTGFLSGSVVQEPTCQCRRHGFDSWVRKIPWRR